MDIGKNLKQNHSMDYHNPRSNPMTQMIQQANLHKKSMPPWQQQQTLPPLQITSAAPPSQPSQQQQQMQYMQVNIKIKIAQDFPLKFKILENSSIIDITAKSTTNSTLTTIRELFEHKQQQHSEASTTNDEFKL